MREGWTYKTFSEVFDLQMGKTPNRDNPLYWNGQNTWVSISDMQCKYIDSSKEKITDKAVSESNIKIVKKGTVIMSFKLSVGRCAIAAKDLFTNEAIMSFTPLKDGIVSPDYIYYYLKGYKWIGANKAVMGMTLNKKSISTNVFAYPPLSEQQHIVSELDLLSSIIEKKKAQLKEYDNLAQSIFYDMFGDPVTNEKGWEVKKLGEVCEYAKTRVRSEAISTNNYVGVDNLLQNCHGKTIATKVPVSLGLTEYWKGDVLIGNIRPYLKKNWLATEKGGCNGDVLAIRRKEVYRETINTRFLFKCLSTDRFFDFAMQYAKGEKMPRGDKKEIMKYLIPLPPLSLQQSFASKIEAIERQKALIQQSIIETETLFNSRMDYYFD